MAIARYTLTQGGADTLAATAMNLFPLDGKSGYEIRSIEVYWKNAENAAPADWEVYVAVQKTALGLTDRISDEDWIVGAAWAQQNTAAAAVALQVEPYRKEILIEPIVTVSQTLNVVAFSSGTAQANSFSIIVHYDVIKLSEIEYLRLLAAGG